MRKYTVKQLARLSGVSVRLLHHYDAIGLLKPSFVGENRYRYYGREELLRLQDILFHRELGVPLGDIARLLETDGRDRLAILSDHRERLAERVERSRQLLRTIDRTIAQLQGDGTMDDKEMYVGFSPEKQAEHEEYLVQRFGEAARVEIEQSRERFIGLGPEGQREAMTEGRDATEALADRFRKGIAAQDAELEPLLARHRGWVERMWGRECTPMAYAGLADLYATTPGFRERYEELAEGFTDWLAGAMKAYSGRWAKR